nr:F-box protein At2g27310-like [Tanacetum cinerariifolium]
YLSYSSSSSKKDTSSSSCHKLSSAVDIRYLDDIIYSQVKVTDMCADNMSSGLKIQLHGISQTIDLTVDESVGCDKATLLHLKESLTLNWILIDHAFKRAGNFSSIKPVSVKQDWSTNETHVRYVTILPGRDLNEIVKCRIHVTLGVGKRGVGLHAKEVMLKLEDLDCKCLNGRDFLVVMQRAIMEENYVKRKVIKDDDERFTSYKVLKELKKAKKELVETKKKKEELVMNLSYFGGSGVGGVTTPYVCVGQRRRARRQATNARWEEFCLVSSLKFGVKNSTDYNKAKDPILFRRRVFSSDLDGRHIRGKDVGLLIKSDVFKKSDDNDVVSQCCVGILQLVLLGVEDRRLVPNWILSDPTNETDTKSYSIEGWFKTWILESFREATDDYYTRYRRHPRIVDWSSKHKFYRHMLKPMLHPGTSNRQNPMTSRCQDAGILDLHMDSWIQILIRERTENVNWTLAKSGTICLHQENNRFMILTDPHNIETLDGSVRPFPSWNDVTWVYMPINAEGVHWVTRAINLANSIFYVFDSMESESGMLMLEQQVKNKTPVINSILETCGYFNGTGRQTHNFRFSYNELFGYQVPQQKNAKDCGVITCSLITKLCLGQAPTLVNDSQVYWDNMRYYMCDTFYKCRCKDTENYGY